MPEGHIRLPRGRVVEQLSPGFAHCVMVASNKNTRNTDSKSLSLYAIGDNSRGQLGLNDKNGNRNRQKWTEVQSGLVDDNIVFASANDYYSLVLSQSGKISYFGEYPGKEAVKKPSWVRRNRVLVIAGSILLVFMIAAAIIIPILIGKFLPPSVSQLSEKEWVTKTYGVAPSMTVSSPLELTKLADAEVPEEVKRLIISSSSYSYSNWRANIKINISTNSYDPSVQTSIDAAANSLKGSLEQEEGVTNVTSSINDYSLLSVEGRKVTGTLNQRGINLSYTAIYLTDENRLWSILLSHEIGDTVGEAIIERMINSIKIDLADVE